MKESRLFGNNSFYSTLPKSRTLFTLKRTGWICYAEKTHGSWILPYVSKVKSAQQVKSILASLDYLPTAFEYR